MSAVLCVGLMAVVFGIQPVLFWSGVALGACLLGWCLVGVAAHFVSNDYNQTVIREPWRRDGVDRPPRSALDPDEDSSTLPSSGPRSASL